MRLVVAQPRLARRRVDGDSGIEDCVTIDSESAPVTIDSDPHEPATARVLYPLPNVKRQFGERSTQTPRPSTTRIASPLRADRTRER
jgi:hypothetical protein